MIWVVFAVIAAGAIVVMMIKRKRRPEIVRGYANQCCLCGVVIPEDRMVCRQCEIREGLAPRK